MTRFRSCRRTADGYHYWIRFLAGVGFSGRMTPASQECLYCGATAEWDPQWEAAA